MKTLLGLFTVICCSVSYGQQSNVKNASKEVLLNNDKMKVVMFEGIPQGEVCGKDMHHHEAHLTVALTDAEVLITTPDGKEQDVKIPKEAAIWFEEGAHKAINTGSADTKFLLVYLKE